MVFVSYADYFMYKRVIIIFVHSFTLRKEMRFSLLQAVHANRTCKTLSLMEYIIWIYIDPASFANIQTVGSSFRMAKALVALVSICILDLFLPRNLRSDHFSMYITLTNPFAWLEHSKLGWLQLTQLDYPKLRGGGFKESYFCTFSNIQTSGKSSRIGVSWSRWNASFNRYETYGNLSAWESNQKFYS